VRLTAFFEFLEGGLELREHELTVPGEVGDGDLRILDGVRFIAESGVGAG
jgi:hypothetical protein